MKLSTTAALLACAASQAQAFSDSAPFILFSTAKLPPPPSTAQLQTSSQVLTTAKSLLASCPTRRYILVSQPNMHAADIRDVSSSGSSSGSGSGSSSSSSSSCHHMPNLCRAVQDITAAAATGSESGGGVWAVAEVIGQVSLGGPLGEYIATACEAAGVVASVERVELQHLPAVSEKKEGRRGEVLGDNDHELGKLLDSLDGDYTVMVFSDPNEFKAYESEFAAEPVHVDMRRWSDEEPNLVSRKKSDNATSNLPLFEKYQFFTPGIFMAFIVLAIVLSILYVGLSALSSLEVSYGAFDKDMGPAAQKKQM
ncbi:BIG/ATPase V1 complex, subunit S1 [Chaetomidium leptoderma]|uniref:Protein BIG1 n=1 Tax=Chaetomidium leptoderma TaxID=669021 RepID=A0AAN7A057_9PEZI|nr:BIG/ATPase V1 complex, subunit S1 [Chaetomidium leptoderma]